MNLFGFGFGMQVKPFHDDESLQEFIRHNVESLRIKTFFETGTYKGTSLKWFAERFTEVRCYSVESNLRYYLQAQKNVKLPNVRIIHSDSVNLLQALLPGLNSPVLFWLDAHWGNDWPVLEELRLIFASEVKAVVLIDDFDVGLPSFGFDTYNGQPLNLSFIRSVVPASVPILSPHYKGQGPEKSRGYVALYHNLWPCPTPEVMM